MSIPAELASATDIDFQQSVDAAAIGIAHVATDGFFLYANPRFCTFLGYTRDELRALNLADLCHPGDLDATLAPLRHMLDGDADVASPEKRFLHKRGHMLWASVHISLVRSANGAPQYFVAAVQDIEKEKRAEQALLTRKAVLRATFDQAAIGITHISSQGYFLRANRKFTDMVGYSEGELLHMHIADISYPEDRDIGLKEFQRSVHGEISTFTVEKRYQKCGGKIVWVRLTGSSIRDPETGQHKFNIAVIEDISDRKLSEERLHQREEFHRITAEAAKVGIWEVLIGSDLECVMSPLMASMLGLQGHKSVYTRQEWEANIFPEDRQEMHAATQRLLTTETLDESSFRVRWPDGSVHYLVGRGKAIRDHKGKAVRVLGASIDLTEQRKVQEDLHIANERLRLAIESTGDGLWDWDFDSNTGYISDRFKEILGYVPHELPNHISVWPAQIHPDDDARVMESYQAYMQEKIPALTMEYRIACKDGEWKWVMARGVLVKDGKDGGRHRLIGTLTDISDKKKADERIWRHANYDSLTQLPNRRLFRDRLEQEVRKAQRTRTAIALLFLDLDRFKQVNDLLGHDAGDALLVQAARRIDSCVRDADTVARLGGDEFTVILAPLEDAERVEHIAQKILTALAEPFRIGTEYVYVSGSAGIALFPDDADSAEELIRKADQAMYAAKNNGKNQFSYFTRLMDERAHQRLRLINELRRALELGQLSVAYQPVVELATNRVVKAEALMRWHHPFYGTVEPAYFVPLAEEAGLISEMGDWIFREAAASAKRWSQALGTSFQIGVNKSPLQFLSREQDTWVEYLRELDLPAQNITVEITEGVLLHASNEVFERLLEYRDAGIQVALDDFGVGYSSMSYLKKFDIDYLKIDQSFVQDMEEDENSRTIAESIIVMAHRLGLKVIAEGVETDRQREILAEAECDYGQGYLFSRPLAAPEFEKRFVMSEPRYLYS
jgi:diguanylate cyclase (GGDEF)-like protein/PAS domain S-box-containing protein